jgi:predicted deacylase
MRVEQLGDGTPELAVVAGVHGDEPCGVRAVERLVDEQPAVQHPVKLVVANEAALERGVRYVNADLNRVFPADLADDAYERALATRLEAELADCVTLSLHSTQSHAEPFAVVEAVGDLARRVCPRLSIVAVVEAGHVGEGRLFASADLVEVECGLQGTETAAENAYTLAREFLTAVGALPGDTVARDLPVFRLVRPIPKESGDEYEVFVENFEPVDAGETFAAVDGEPLVADEPFSPVLVSPRGYADVFGYAAEKVGGLTPAD